MEEVKPPPTTWGRIQRRIDTNAKRLVSIEEVALKLLQESTAAKTEMGRLCSGEVWVARVFWKKKIRCQMIYVLLSYHALDSGYVLTRREFKLKQISEDRPPFASCCKWDIWSDAESILGEYRWAKANSVLTSQASSQEETFNLITLDQIGAPLGGGASVWQQIQCIPEEKFEAMDLEEICKLIADRDSESITRFNWNQRMYLAATSKVRSMVVSHAVQVSPDQFQVVRRTWDGAMESERYLNATGTLEEAFNGNPAFVYRPFYAITVPEGYKKCTLL